MAQIFGLSTDGLVSRFERLTDRERQLTLMLAGVFVFIFIGGGFYWIFSNGSERRATLEAMELQLSDMEKKKGDYAEAKKRQQRFENTRVPNLRGYIESKALGLGLPTDSLVESKDALLQKATPGNLRLEVAEFSMRRVSIDMLTAFLEAVEGKEKDSTIKVSRLRIGASTGTPDLLDASMLVATWKKK